MDSRQHHHHRVDIGESPKRGTFIGDAILSAYKGDIGTGRGTQIVERCVCVLALYTQHDNIVSTKLNLRRVRDRRNWQTMFTIGCDQRKSRRLQSCEMRAAGDQRHIMVLLVKPPTYHPTDATRAVDYETHGPIIAEYER